MGLREQAFEDLAVNVSADGNPVVFIDPDGVSYPAINCIVKRVDARIDPQTAQQFHEPMLAVSVPIGSLPTASGEIIYPGEDWRVTGTDVTGESFETYISQAPRHDLMLGFVVYILERFTE